MAWITPFKNWIASRVPLPSDFNRIEGNIDYLKERGDADRTLTLTGDVSGATTYDDNSGISVITTVADKIVKRDSAGNFVANIITATLNGLAAAATKLATARTISISGNASGSTSFDGSGNADISLTVAHAARAAKLQTARTISISGNATGSTSFDGSGNADISLTVSHAAQAAKLQTARTISISGNATGSTSFDGSGNADISLTVSGAKSAEYAGYAGRLADNGFDTNLPTASTYKGRVFWTTGASKLYMSITTDGTNWDWVQIG